MSSCDLSRLDSLLHGELDTLEARRVSAHAKSCAGCGNELAALSAERELFQLRSRTRAPLSSVRRAVMARCDELANRAKVRSRIAGGLGFALTLAFVALLPLRQPHSEFAAVSEVNASFCDPVSPQTSFSHALHCGGGELVAQAEGEFSACLVASPLVAAFRSSGLGDACEASGGE